MERPPTASVSRPLARKDRMVLALEYQGNRRLRSLGTLLYRLTKGHIAPSGRVVLLLTTRGRASGRAHTVLLQAFPDGANMVVVAANSGRPSDPDWLRNLEAEPAARVEIEGRTLPIRAERLSPADTAAFWPRILRAAPSYARYREATGRAIPLVRLVPVGSGAGVLP